MRRVALVLAQMRRVALEGKQCERVVGRLWVPTRLSSSSKSPTTTSTESSSVRWKHVLVVAAVKLKSCCGGAGNRASKRV